MGINNVALGISQVVSWINVIAILVMAIIAIVFFWRFLELAYDTALIFTLLVAFSTVYYLATRFESFFIQRKANRIEFRLRTVEKAVAKLQARKS